MKGSWLWVTSVVRVEPEMFAAGSFFPGGNNEDCVSQHSDKMVAKARTLGNIKVVKVGKHQLKNDSCGAGGEEVGYRT